MAKILMHSLPNGRESRRADKVRSRGRSPEVTRPNVRPGVS